MYGPLIQAAPGAVHKIFDVNVVAALGFVQQAHRVWMGEHGDAVVNIASVSGLRSTAAIAAYGMFKAALIRLTEELAWELGPSIRVNAVVPAVVKTRCRVLDHRRDGASGRRPARHRNAPLTGGM